MNSAATSPAMVEAVQLARSLACVPDAPYHCPRQGIAAAQIVDSSGHEQVKPIIVTDFYRSAADADR